MSSRELAPEEVEELLKNRVVGPLTGFRSRLGRPFAAALKFSPEMKAEFDFGTSSDDEDNEAPNFADQEPLGACPKCKARVFEQPMAYICEKSAGRGRSCDFRSGRVILQRQIEREQMRKLLSEGKTDLLNGFVSKKGRRFSAYLVPGADGKIGFEFAPRPAKSKTDISDTPENLTAASKTSRSRTAAMNQKNPPKAKATKAPARPKGRKTAKKG